ncbi:MAG TPA: LytTR family DNA-binding domain-containing protein [Bacteroidales bacterium]|nr:LytTR family DNA-binding domain-containing protein [Bacteroidales bacterium]
MKKPGVISVLIVDDEPEVRQLLSIMLRSHSGVSVCGEAEHVNEAIMLTKKHKPELVLLDIQMPEKDGFTFIEEVKTLSVHPGIIFITAYESYAIRAIKNAAFDYLTKPIVKDELFEAVDRFLEFNENSNKPDIKALIEIFKNQKPERIRFNTRSGFFFICPDDIIYIKADGNYSHMVLVNGKKEVSTVSLGSLETMLEKYSFLRVSRSYIVNMKYISRVDRKSNTVELEQDEQVHELTLPAQKIRLLEGYF